MAYTRKGRRPRSRRRLISRRGRRYLRKAYRKPRHIIHNFKRTFSLGAILVAAASDNQGWSFKLSDLPSVSDFTALFDAYRICAVKLEFMPDVTNSPMTANNGMTYLQTLGMGSLHTVIDHNDDLAPGGGPEELMQYDTYKRKRLSTTWKRYFRVNTVSKNYYADENTQELKSAYDETNWKKWLSMANVGNAQTESSYFGFKTIADGLANVSGDESFPITVYATYYFQCRSVI